MGLGDRDPQLSFSISFDLSNGQGKVTEPLTQVSKEGIGLHYQQTLLYLQSPMTLGVLARPD